MSTKALTGQPKPFYLIFLIEIWERFGYYGVQALLVLYMVQKYKFTDTHADLLFAAFSALVFLLPCVGGYIGDKVLGTKRTILIGAITLAIGYFLFSLPHTPPSFLALPLAIIAVGNGLFKANPSSLLSKVYEGTKHNVDGGFTLYYMAVNVGAFLSMNLTPILNKYFGWHVAFFVCFVGLMLAVVNFLFMKHNVKGVGSKPDLAPMRKDYLLYVVLFSLALVVASYYLLSFYHLVSWILSIGTIILFAYYFSLIYKAKPEERPGMILFVVLFALAVVFFVLYFQMPTSLTLFALRNVQHSILGIPIQPAQFQMLNPFWIVVMSPLLAFVYHRLSRNKKDLSMPAKFSLGTLLAGLAFLSLPFGSLFNDGGVISGLWLVFSYWLQSTGELLVSALGLALAARYVPQRFMGFTMGLWFLCTSIASIIAGKVATFASVPSNISKDPVASLPIYNDLFLRIGIIAVIVALGMFALVPVLRKLVQRHESFAGSIKVDNNAVITDDELIEERR